MKKGLSLKNIILSVVALIGGIATFLPWAVVTVSLFGISSSESVNGIGEGATDGWFTLVAFIAIIVLSCIFITKEDMHIGAKIGISVVSLVPIGLGLYNIINVGSKSLGSLATANASIGLWLVLIMGIVTAALPWIPFKNMIGGSKQ